MIESLRRERPALDFHVVWLGAGENSRPYYQALYELTQAQALRYFRFAGIKENPAPWLAAGDAFALLSREDPFPLVMLEAAACGLPVLGFTGSGGVTEFVRPDMGFTIPYNDLPAMAQKLALLADDVELRRRMSQQARQRAAEFDGDTLLPRCARAIEQTAGKSI